MESINWGLLLLEAAVLQLFYIANRLDGIRNNLRSIDSRTDRIWDNLLGNPNVHSGQLGQIEHHLAELHFHVSNLREELPEEVESGLADIAAKVSLPNEDPPSDDG